MSNLNKDDDQSYMVDLVTNLFAILIIFLLLMILTQVTKTTANKSQYIKQDLEKDNFVLSRRIYFPPNIDFYLLTGNNNYYIDFDEISDFYLNNENHIDATIQDKNINLYQYFDINHHDVISYGLGINYLPKNERIGFIKIDDHMSLQSYIEKNTFAKNRALYLFASIEGISKLQAITKKLLDLGYNYRFKIYDRHDSDKILIKISYSYLLFDSYEYGR